MSELTPAAVLAWEIAAAEAAAGRHAAIDKAHVLIGICSLEDAAGLPEGNEIISEQRRVSKLLARLGLRAEDLRFALRSHLTRGSRIHAAGTVLNRTEGCRAAFGRAQELALPGDSASCLHLLAALCERSDPVLDPLLRDAGVRPEAVARLAIAFATGMEE